MSDFHNFKIDSNEADLLKNLSSFFKSLQAKDIVLLYGDIGAGKTSLVREFVNFKKKQLKLEDQLDSWANSPSYNLIQDYKIGDLNIFHIDLYRLDDEEDLESTGFWDLVNLKNSILFIEWPEKLEIQDLIRPRSFELKIKIKADSRSYFVRQIK